MADQEDDAQTMVDNPKRTAILAVDSTVTTSQTNLAASRYNGSYSDKMSEGLTQEVWASPKADTYRTQISTALTNADNAISAMHTTLTNAANNLEEKVPSDSSEAKWPNCQES
ncbi:Uncharacterised protein [Actinomyces bovis]|uniref:WXG100 family type VII secretion target n=1 Tax=Actinomyces bovis TaxID=1658 RepID=A0ABY1VNC6_9ACTO|nr:hypothetical protein [Actinomyces bovis]SPT53610.1 Uncharacterised protein [Actinomyces bovis]VEG55651.1 Uncharacterised protein [Actinomyces israelii]